MEYAASANKEEFVLWLRFRSGDSEAFACLYETYAGVLYNYGYHILPDAPLVQDAIQELFANLWQTRSRLSETTSVKYYLFRSLRRQINRMREKEERYETLPDTDKSAFLPFAFSAEVHRISHETEEEQIRQLQHVLLNLPERQSEAIRLRFFEGFELQEVARIMQMNEQSVRNLIQRSIRKMRQTFDFLLLFLAFCFFS